MCPRSLKRATAPPASKEKRRKGVVGDWGHPAAATRIEEFTSRPLWLWQCVRNQATAARPTAQWRGVLSWGSLALPRLGSQGDDHRVLGGYGLGVAVNATPTKSPALAGPEEQRER